MGAHIRKKIFSHNGYRTGDIISHAKIGSSIGKILFFAEFYEGMYALVDYGKRKRFERVEDLLPVRSDIY